MRLDLKVAFSEPQNAKWYCYDSYGTRGSSYSLDRPVVLTAGQQSNNCQIDHVKSEVTINKSL
jgi:hypothetical protein